MSAARRLLKAVAVDCAPTHHHLAVQAPGKLHKSHNTENQSNRPQSSKEIKRMLKSKKKFTAIGVATLSLFVLGAAAFAQKHFMLANALRPEVKVELSGSVLRESNRVALEKATAVNPGEVLDWTMTSENGGNAPALNYKAVGHIPHGTEFVAGSAKADGASAVYSIDGGKSYSAQPTIEQKQA